MRRRRRSQVSTRQADSGLLGRAWRHRRRGEHRRAMLTLKEACLRDKDSARLWTLYAVQCVRAGRRDEATKALKQAVFLRQRSRDAARVRVTRAMLELVEQGEHSFRLAAA